MSTNILINTNYSANYSSYNYSSSKKDFAQRRSQGRRSVGRARGASNKVRALVSEGEPNNGGSGCIPGKFFGATPSRLA